MKTIAKFGGLAPRFNPGLKQGLAAAAEDIDLGSGKIRPVAGHLAVGSGTGDSLVYHGGAWVSGTGRHFCPWMMDGVPMLFHLDGGVARKTVAGVTADLGQALPGAPTVARTGVTLDLTQDVNARIVLRASATAGEYRPVVLYNRRIYDIKKGTMPATEQVTINASVATPGVLGSLGHQEWASGDQDSLGFDALYIGLTAPVIEYVDGVAVANPEDNGITYLSYEGEVELIPGDPASLTFMRYFIYDGTAPEFGLEKVTTTRYKIACVSGPSRCLAVLPDLDYTVCFSNDEALIQGSYPLLEAGEWVFHSGDLYVGTEGELVTTEYDGTNVASEVWLARFNDNAITTFSIADSYGGVTDTVQYAITTTRNVGGVDDESGLGALSSRITAVHESLSVSRPAITDTLVTHWTLYRISDSSGEFQKVATMPVATASYEDTLSAGDLGAAPVTYYTSDQGNEILFVKPGSLDGLCGPHAGMLFGWKDSTLVWSEPGRPDGWPAYYTMNFPSRIMAVTPFAGSVAVLTATGAFRVDGTHPELLQQGEGVGSEPCVSTACMKTGKGVAFMSDSGVCLFNLYETGVLTDPLFGEAYFRDWAKDSVFFAENDGRLYVFHDGGALVFDQAAGLWTTLSLVATAAWRNPEDGELYVVSGGEVLRLHGADSVIPWLFLSGDNYGPGGDDTEFAGVRVAGSGFVELALYVDGDLKVSRVLDFTLDRGKVVKLRQEHAGRALWYELSGTGEVTEVVIL